MPLFANHGFKKYCLVIELIQFGNLNYIYILQLFMCICETLQYIKLNINQLYITCYKWTFSHQRTYQIYQSLSAYSIAA